jgi:NADH-quinone oxidoreductase subunit E
MAFALSAEHERELADILARYPNKMAACIPMLHLCQEANENWISDEVIQFVAQRLELSSAHVKGVVTFYSLFNQEKPGKHQVWVCRTLPCALRGAVTLRTAECLASCGTAPMMQVDKDYYENLSTTEVDRILERLLHEG